MEIRYDQFGDQFSSKLQIESRAFASAPLDWPGLMARLAAAHDARQILAARSDYRAIPSGSFAPAWAADVAAYLATTGCRPDHNSSSDVNQNAKVDGKPPGPIGVNSKGKDPTAVQGLP